MSPTLNYFNEIYVLQGCELNKVGVVARREGLIQEALEIAKQLYQAI